MKPFRADSGVKMWRFPDASAVISRNVRKVSILLQQKFQDWCHDSLIASNEDKLARFQAFAAISSSSALLWDVTQSITVFCNRRFGTTYRYHLQGSSNPRSFKCEAESSWNAWTLNVGLTGCPETSLAKYRYTLCKIQEERWSKDRLLGRGHTILTSRELTSCEAAHTRIVMSRYLMWAFGASQSGEITFQSYLFQCGRRHKQYIFFCKQLTDNFRAALDT